MEKNIKITPFTGDDPDIEQIGQLYCATFLGEDYSHKEIENAINNIRKHASYKGFKGLKAKDGNRNVVGFSYGYTSLPGQFYREKIADQLSDTEIHTWLTDCFEFVELAVSPCVLRKGIASKLHDLLMCENKHRTSVLTTGIDNVPAINLYLKKGWQSIKENASVISEENLQVIMGKELK